MSGCSRKTEPERGCVITSIGASLSLGSCRSKTEVDCVWIGGWTSASCWPGGNHSATMVCQPEGREEGRWKEAIPGFLQGIGRGVRSKRNV
jgi:hypothetical protein